MARYHFNDTDGQCHVDLEGVELATIDEARTMALKLLSAIVSEAPGEFWRTGEWTMKVTDDSGLILFSILTVATDGAAKR